MKIKQYIATALAFVFMISILEQTAGPAQAADLTCSEAVIDFIKDYEGFRSDVYWDGGKAYIGYGTCVNSWEYPNGISRDGADALMREALRVKEDTLNQIADKHDFSLTQSQFDALMSFTYNIGTGWMSSKNRIFRYLTEGVENHTDLEIVNAIAIWCHMSGRIVKTLVERRLREACMFLYGNYDGGAENYRYIEYDAGNGDVENSMMFYEHGKPYGALQEAVRSGYTLSGWVTDAGGSVNAYTVADANIAVSAVWVQEGVKIPTSVYSDVSQNDWYYKYVIKLSESGVFSGYEDGTFKPENQVKCGEALKLILRTVGFGIQSPTNAHWASGYLDLAIAKGITDKTIITDLEAVIDRQTVAELAAKSLGLPPLDPEPVFSDTQDGFVLALYRCDIIAGNSESGTLMYYPGDSIKRAELSSIIYKISNSDVIPE